MIATSLPIPEMEIEATRTNVLVRPKSGSLVVPAQSIEEIAEGINVSSSRFVPKFHDLLGRELFLLFKQWLPQYFPGELTYVNGTMDQRDMDIRVDHIVDGKVLATTYASAVAFKGGFVRGVKEPLEDYSSEVNLARISATVRLEKPEQLRYGFVQIMQYMLNGRRIGSHNSPNLIAGYFSEGVVPVDPLFSNLLLAEKEAAKIDGFFRKNQDTMVQVARLISDANSLEVAAKQLEDQVMKVAEMDTGFAAEYKINVAKPETTPRPLRRISGMSANRNSAAEALLEPLKQDFPLGILQYMK